MEKKVAEIILTLREMQYIEMPLSPAEAEKIREAIITQLDKTLESIQSGAIPSSVFTL